MFGAAHHMEHVGENRKLDSTLRISHAVPNPSTVKALRRVTAEVKRGLVLPTRYSRQRSICRSRAVDTSRERHFHSATHYSMAQSGTLNVRSIAGSMLGAARRMERVGLIDSWQHPRDSLGGPLTSIIQALRRLISEARRSIHPSGSLALLKSLHPNGS